MGITLGREPDQLAVRVAAGAAFVATLRASIEWPAGTEIELRFPLSSGEDVVWPTTIEGTDASWLVPPAQVDELLARRQRAAELWYRDAAGTPLQWARGQVVTRD